MPGLIIQYRRGVEQFTLIGTAFAALVLKLDPGVVILSENNE
jgi:hypothetical protein